MEKIPQTFERIGWIYNLIKRTKKVAIYSHAPKENPKKIEGYEVHKIRIQKPHTNIIGGVTVNYKEKELLATDSFFGTYGWHFTSKQRAKLCYEFWQKNPTSKLKEMYPYIDTHLRK